MAVNHMTVLETGHMSELANALASMFDEALGLPDPSSARIYGVLEGHVHNEFSLQFPQDGTSRQALAQWADRFGGVITAKTRDRDTGPELWVRVTFTFHDAIDVEAFAHIPLPEGADAAGQDSSPYPVTPF